MTIANVDGIVKFAIFFDVYFVRRIILLENDFFYRTSRETRKFRVDNSHHTRS